MTAESDTKLTPGQDPEADVPELHAEALAPGDVAQRVDPSPRFHRDWRGNVAAAALLNLLAGAWLIASPFVLGYGVEARVNAIVCGGLVAVLALLRTGAWRAEWLSLLNVGLGIWLFGSGFWLAESPAATWNSWLLGIAIVVLALLGIDATEEGRMQGSGASRGRLSAR